MTGVDDLDETVHQRVRLLIMGVLAEVKRADFKFLKDELELSDGNLSRHLQVLESAGLVVIDKAFDKKRSHTWVSLNKAGRAAFDREVTALRKLVSRFD